MIGPVAAMLGARSIAVVGASERPGSFGQRMVIEALRGTAGVQLVNPRYTRIGGRPCAPSLAAAGQADLVLLGVGDHALAGQLSEAAAAGARSAVVFGSAHAPGLRDRLRQIASEAGMALCGGGCMGFVNVATGLRALGYVERDGLPAGPVSLITHSGSVFSTLLRTRRALGYRLAVSSGQELVTGTADYLEYVLDNDPGDGVIALVLETVREAPRVRAQLHRAARMGVPVVLLPVGGSAAGSSLVTAHSGALAGSGAMWEALCEDTGALRVHDLAELTDTLELIALGRRGPRPARAQGIAAVHDSGAERALTADLAQELGVPFAPIGAATRQRLAAVLDDGLTAENPLDLWGSGADTRQLFRECLLAMDGDPAVAATVLAVDLVPEYDGDTSYADAVLDAAALAQGPIAVLTGVASAVDDSTAARLREAGVAVLEGTRSGLVALRNLLQLNLSAQDPQRPRIVQNGGIDAERRARWRARLAHPRPLDGTESFALLGDYGIPAVPVRPAQRMNDAVVAAAALGYPVVLKTDMAVAHKSDAGGVLLGLQDDSQVRSGYRTLTERFGPRVLVCGQAAPGTEVSIGIARDPHLGLMVVLAAGGTLVELIDDRVVALPPLSAARADELISRLRIARLLNGFRGAAAGDLQALATAICGVSQLAMELGDLLAGLDVNPVIVSPEGAAAADVLVEAAIEPWPDQKMA